MKTVIALTLLACSASATASTWLCQASDVSNPERSIALDGAYIIKEVNNTFSINDHLGGLLFQSGSLTDSSNPGKVSGFKDGILYAKGTDKMEGSFSMFWMVRKNKQVKGIFFNCTKTKGI